jgi:hypothetical protein
MATGKETTMRNLVAILALCGAASAQDAMPPDKAREARIEGETLFAGIEGVRARA